MPLPAATRDRLVVGVAQLLRAGRHLGARAAGRLHGDLSSFGWALLTPLERLVGDIDAVSDPQRPASVAVAG